MKNQVTQIPQLQGGEEKQLTTSREEAPIRLSYIEIAFQKKTEKENTCMAYTETLKLYHLNEIKMTAVS